MSIQATNLTTAATVQPTQTAGNRGDALSLALTRSQDEAAVAQQHAEPLKAVRQTNETDRRALEDAARKIAEFVKPMTSSLSFTVDDRSGQRVVKVIDNDTKEVIRQFPSEEALAIAAALDRLQGLLVKEKA